MPVLRKPHWLKTRLGGGDAYHSLADRINKQNLHTVCDEAHCPNKGDCWSRGIASLMILGRICTRACEFCNVETGKPLPVDTEEPQRVADAVRAMGVRYLTLTSVDRDDLDDQGAEIWFETIQRIRHAVPGIHIEALVPDFRGKLDLLDAVLASKPDILNHNLETVPRLQRQIRRAANWEHSMSILEHARAKGFVTKTGLMVGLGESDSEVFQFLEFMAKAQVDIVTIGQYLQPSPQNIEVQRFCPPETFAEYAQYARTIGIPRCDSAPLVRSSWHAQESAQGFL